MPNAAKSSSKDQKNAELTSDSIQAQIEAFLKTGGKINQIEKGVSGNTQMSGKKHIVISSK